MGRQTVNSTQAMQLEEINRLEVMDFVRALGGVFEHSTWVANAVCATRPFATVDALHAAMIMAVRASSAQQQLDLLRAHPELAGRLARAGELTEDSRAEQGSIGLNRLNTQELQHFDELNRAYRKKFGFPFIIAVRDHSKQSIVQNFESRLGNSVDKEIENALGQVFRITRLRLELLVADD